MEYRIPGNMQVVMGVPVGKLKNLDDRVTYLEQHGSSGGGGTLVPQHVVGVIDGSNKVFSIATAITGASLINLNGFLQQDGGVDYTVSGTTVTYVTAPPNTGGNDTHYLYSGGGTVVSPTVTSGTGAPASTPVALGSIYIDTGSNNIYMATGTSSSADWKLLASFS